MADFSQSVSSYHVSRHARHAARAAHFSCLTLCSKMANAQENFVSDLIDVAVASINDLKNCERNIVLTQEQPLAVREMLNGKDVLAVLPTGFGNSMIFTVFNFAKRELLKRTGNDESTSVLVVSPLKSLIEDQMMELRSMGRSAEELKSDENLAFRPQFIYYRAEEAIEKDFLDCLKDSAGKLHKSLAAVVIDETHKTGQVSLSVRS